MKKLLSISLLLSVVGVQAGQNNKASNGLKILADVALKRQSELQQDYMDEPPSSTPLTPEDMEQGDPEDLSNQAPGEKLANHQCETCGKFFKRKDHLIRHITIHTGERLFECLNPGCHKKFSRKDSLNLHMKLHKQEKPLECYKCHRRFKVKHYLKSHLNRKTPCV